MKKTIAVFCFILIAMILVPFASAQTNTVSSNAAGFRGQSLNGATGLFTIPTGRIGWDRQNFGFDIGYRAIINNEYGTTHIPALTLSMFKMVEISAAFDIQPPFRYMGEDQSNEDLLLGLKIKLPTTPSTAVALGGNIQLINLGNENFNYNAFQPYLAVTYRGSFFTMPAETTIVFGKTLYSGGNTSNDTNIDFGMGFDILLFPDVFGHAIHWIIDFSNFAYSDNAWPNYAPYHNPTVWRGVLNTGFRIDISSFPAMSKYKFLVDFIFNDLFDDGHRSFTIGVVFGLEP